MTSRHTQKTRLNPGRISIPSPYEAEAHHLACLRRYSGDEAASVICTGVLLPLVLELYKAGACFVDNDGCHHSSPHRSNSATGRLAWSYATDEELGEGLKSGGILYVAPLTADGCLFSRVLPGLAEPLPVDPPWEIGVKVDIKGDAQSARLVVYIGPGDDGDLLACDDAWPGLNAAVARAQQLVEVQA